MNMIIIALNLYLNYISAIPSNQFSTFYFWELYTLHRKILWYNSLIMRGGCHAL